MLKIASFMVLKNKLDKPKDIIITKTGENIIIVKTRYKIVVLNFF